MKLNIITLQYLLVPRANKGEDAFKWVAFYGNEQRADVPFVHADTPKDALEKLILNKQE